MSEFDSGASSLTQALEALLIERGPLSESQLVDALGERGVDLGSDAEERVSDQLDDVASDDVFPLPDGRWVHLPSLVTGRVVTHRLTAPELLDDVLTLTPDLTLLYALTAESGLLRLLDGAALTIAHPLGPDDLAAADDQPARALDEFGSVVLPRGTLAGLTVHEGDVVSVTITAEGVRLAQMSASEVQPHPETVRRHLIEISGEQKPIELETALLSVCVAVDDAFRRPHVPVTDLLVDAGLARHGDWLAAAGFDFAGYWTDIRASALARRHQLSRDEALGVAALNTLHGQLTDVFEAVLRARQRDGKSSHAALVSEIDRALAGSTAAAAGSPHRTVGSMVPLVARPKVASALLEETLALRLHESAAETLALMVELLEESTSRATRPALRWLRAKAYESLGRVRDAEDCLRAAERLDPSWPLTLLDLARYAGDRGDASRGLALLARAQPFVDEELEQQLSDFQPQPGPTLGRNEPCWCGSGRKFKQCHLHRSVAQPLERRAAWLYAKAVRWVSDGLWDDEIAAVTEERGAFAEDEAAVAAAEMDAIVVDAVLFEGGAFEGFVEQRGFLLPDDERLLAEQWLLVDRSVFDVTAVRRGAGFTARDVRTGDVVDVRDRAASRSLKPGNLVCARIVPAGDTMQVFGGIEPVALHERDALVALLDSEPDPDELVAFLSRRFAPPILGNTEGDPIVSCDAMLAVRDPESLSAELDRTFARTEGSEPREWVFARVVDGLDRVCAMLRLTGTELHVSTNSDRRMHEVLAILGNLDPELEVTSEERQPIATTRDAARLARQLPSPGGPGAGALNSEELPPEIQGALAEQMRTYERQWLDLPVPALNGLTPRQAADDPTRRDDLDRLLTSFEGEQDSPMGMSPARLRADLGLEPKMSP